MNERQWYFAHVGRLMRSHRPGPMPGRGLRFKVAPAVRKAGAGGGVPDDPPPDDDPEKKIVIPTIEAQDFRELPAVEFVEPEDLLKGVTGVREYANRLKKRGDLHGEAIEKMAKALRLMHEKAMETEKIVKSGARQLPSRSDAMPSLKSIPAHGKKQLYRFLATNLPHEIGYAGMFAKESGLPSHLQAFVRRHAVDENTQARILEWQAANDICIIVDAVLSANPESGYGQMPRHQRIKRLKVYKDFKAMSEELRDAAMDTATAGEGLEWVPTILSAQLKQLIYAELTLAGFIDWATMPSGTWDNPVEGADAIAYLISQGLDDPAAPAAKPAASVVGTRKMTLTAVKFAARVVMSWETEEDLIIPAVPHVLMRIARAIARGREKAMVDGQKTGAIDTSDVPAASDVRSAWDGFRKVQKLVGTSLEVDCAVLSAEVLANLKGVLKEYGQVPEDGLWVGGYTTFIKLLTLYDKTTGGSPMLLTQDKAGQGNAFQRGQLGLLFGSPFTVSQFVREDLNASGIFDNVTVTRTILLYTNRRVWQGGERRAVTIRRFNELKGETDQIELMGTWRGDLKTVNYAGTQRFVALGRNITSF